VAYKLTNIADVVILPYALWALSRSSTIGASRVVCAS
jgi:hypothetical protein